MTLALIPILPFIAAAIISLPFRFLKTSAGYISSIAAAVSLILVILLKGSAEEISVLWFTSGNYELTFSLKAGGLEWLTALTVASISLIVTIYSVKFIKEREQFYFRVLSFFTGSMLTLVLSGSFILMFLAWEFVGLSSFLLIGFWVREKSAKKAAGKAFLMTRIGDFGFLLALLLVLTGTGSTDISMFLATVKGGNNAEYAGTILLSFLFLTASLGKSAQLPFSSWLPDAMAGPAPVSALIHSATMVAAGVFLMLKLFPLYEAAHLTLKVILWTGFLTSLIAALIATTQYDIKRILAWSTISQLGEMFLAIGMSGALAAAFHLSAHAVFKAGLFLTAGIIGHAAGSKDIREVSGLIKTMPLTAISFILLALALAGFPPFAGYWSEEEILADAVKHGPLYASMMLLLIFLAGVYISRAGVSLLFGNKKPENPGKQGKSALYSTFLLAFTAVFLGYILKITIASLLPFDKPPSPGLWWKTSAIAASLGGLAVGSYRAYYQGSLPTFGKLPGYLAAIVDGFVYAGEGVVFYVSGIVSRTEKLLDTAALNITERIKGIAATINISEKGLDAGARFTQAFTLALAGIKDQAVNVFDGFANLSGLYTLRNSYSVEKFESSGFGRGLDRFAEYFSLSGKQIRRIQTGKIFLYVMILFSGLLAAFVVTGMLYLLI